ncbi:MAG: malonyl-CoA synthase [Pseudomonadota bacterium]
MSDSLFDLIRERFPRDPEASFIETPGGRVMTYGEVEEATGRLARLLAEAGVAKGDRVAAIVEKSPEAILLYLAVLRAGGVYLPLNTAYRAQEIAYFLGDAEPRAVVWRPEAEAEIAALAGTAKVFTLGQAGDGSLMDASADLDPDFQSVPSAADDLAALLYTSGTTGRSKGAMLSHWNLASNALALHSIWGFRPGDVLLHALPIFHTHGLFVATNCVLLNGSSMLFLNRFEPDLVCRLLPRATVMMGVPTFYTRLLEHPGFDQALCGNMRLFISGSAPLLEETHRAFEAKTGMAILERYGMTETGMNSSNPLEGARVPGTVGYALPEVELRVADEDGRVLAAGETGVLEVRGPNVFSGYWRQPEKTAAEFRADGFFITGDVACMAPDGRVSIVGRAKDLIISGGFNVYPKEVELVIDEQAGVRESAVIGLPHPDFGEAVTAIVVPEDDACPPEAASLIAAAKEALANYKVPKQVFVMDALPRNAMGKVQKNALRERYKDSFS